MKKSLFDAEKLYRIVKDFTSTNKYIYTLFFNAYTTVLQIQEKDSDFCAEFSYEEVHLGKGYCTLNLDTLNYLRESTLRQVTGTSIELDITGDNYDPKYQETSYLSDLYLGSLLLDFIKGLPNDFNTLYLSNELGISSCNETKTRYKQCAIDFSCTHLQLQSLIVDRRHLAALCKSCYKSNLTLVSSKDSISNIKYTFEAGVKKDKYPVNVVFKVKANPDNLFKVSITGRTASINLNTFEYDEEEDIYTSHVYGIYLSPDSYKFLNSLAGADVIIFSNASNVFCLAATKGDIKHVVTLLSKYELNKTNENQ